MNNSVRALILGLGMSCGLVAVPTLATARIGIDIDIAPPAPRVEVVPGLRAGFVWGSGYWEYHERAHVWIPGHWIRERRGEHWVADRWEHRGEKWHHERGHWER